jgi:hypothetical protein
MSVSQALSPQHVLASAVADDYAGRFADDGGPSPTEPRVDLRLLWAALKEQRISGVWWPRGRNITVELAALLPAVDSYFGAPLIRLSLNPHAWDHQPRRLYVGRRVIRVGWFNSIDPAIVGIGAIPTEPIILCIVPPEWNAASGRRLFRALRYMKVWPTEPDQLLECAIQGATASSS